MRTTLLDCTLRDGGYYTDWDFPSQIVETYIEAMNKLPIGYLEVGYRTKPDKNYLGKFGYTPISALQQLKEKCRKKIAVMLNEKNTHPEDLDRLLKPAVGLIDMVRIAIDPKNFDRAILLAKEVKSMGFEVGFNAMYMSKWSTEYKGFLSKLNILNDFCDLFCMVDSFGGVTPEDVVDIYKEVRTYTTVPVGFHGHNNLQLGLINTITAINLGVDFADATILGMGRGAGNLNMELLLTYLNARHHLNVDFNVLGDVISAFTPLMEKYHWGTNLPYMLAGANCIPQKEVMDWVTNRVYSFNSIVRALDNRKDHIEDNAKYPLLDYQHKKSGVIIVGGGSTVPEHVDGIRQFILSHSDIAVVFATARYAALFTDIKNEKYYCLVGSEAKRLSRNISAEQFDGCCILPPYPRVMGTDVPDFAVNRTFELPAFTFTEKYPDSCTTVALQTAIALTNRSIFIVGYDGYRGNILSEKEMSLSNENRTLFESYENKTGQRLVSLTPTLYKNLDIKSVYQFI